MYSAIWLNLPTAYPQKERSMPAPSLFKLRHKFRGVFWGKSSQITDHTSLCMCSQNFIVCIQRDRLIFFIKASTPLSHVSNLIAVTIRWFKWDLRCARQVFWAVKLSNSYRCVPCMSYWATIMHDLSNLLDIHREGGGAYRQQISVLIRGTYSMFRCIDMLKGMADRSVHELFRTGEQVNSQGRQYLANPLPGYIRGLWSAKS